MIINHFKMRSNIVSYNLAGMGCSAGVIAVSLARELLQVPGLGPCMYSAVALPPCRDLSAFYGQAAVLQEPVTIPLYAFPGQMMWTVL